VAGVAVLTLVFHDTGNVFRIDIQGRLAYFLGNPDYRVVPGTLINNQATNRNQGIFFMKDFSISVVIALSILASPVFSTLAMGAESELKMVDIDLDMVGIELGMEPDVVVSAMQKHDSDILVEHTNSRVHNEAVSGYERIVGTDQSRREMMVVDFWPPPFSKTAGFISRQKIYQRSKQPTIEIVRNALSEKYGTPSYVEEYAGGEINIVWMFRNNFQMQVPYKGKEFINNTEEAQACLMKSGVSRVYLQTQARELQRSRIRNIGLPVNANFVDAVEQCKQTMLWVILYTDRRVETVRAFSATLVDYDAVSSNYSSTASEQEAREQERINVERDAARKVRKPKL